MAKSGLNLREKPEKESPVISKIPFGAQVTCISTNEALVPSESENMRGYWQKVKYNAMTGYVSDIYLFPWPLPSVGSEKSIKEYMGKISPPYMPAFNLKNYAESITNDTEWSIEKQIFKNGFEFHEYHAIEYYSITYFIPGVSLQQGFMLCRLLDEFKPIFSEIQEFPLKNQKLNKNGKIVDIQVIPSAYGKGISDFQDFEKIRIELSSDIVYKLELLKIEGQLVIVFGYGV
ncbi:MAG: SH3 domain-containing protein [Flavobacteriales bacterium]|nr:SH3 domain-containing protein [Flavobacteriales bacterium]MDW8432172.1 SH3 domain-containing protein [Flavobacteriales bacterium]